MSESKAFYMCELTANVPSDLAVRLRQHAEAKGLPLESMLGFWLWRAEREQSIGKIESCLDAERRRIGLDRRYEGDGDPEWFTSPDAYRSTEGIESAAGRTT